MPEQRRSHSRREFEGSPTCRARDTVGPGRFDDASLQVVRELPGERLKISTEVGWTSMLLSVVRFAAREGEFDASATTDLWLTLALKGEVEIRSLEGGVWRLARLRPGSSLRTAGGTAARVRWSTGRSATPAEVLNLFIPAALVLDARRTAGGREGGGLDHLGTLVERDPVIAAVASALVDAMDRRASDLYAETAARWIAMHLASVADRSASGGRSVPARPVADRGLARAIEYMSGHLSAPLSLDALAHVAGISKFHFARRFKAETGTTPLAFLQDLRLSAARRLLASTVDPVGIVAAACGYASGSHFATAFARRYGETPTEFRRRSG